MLFRHQIQTQLMHITFGTVLDHLAQEGRNPRQAFLRLLAPGQFFGLFDQWFDDGRTIGYMDAPGIGVHQAVAHGERPRPATAAQLLEFAAAALALQPGIAQRLENRRLIPDVPELRIADAAFFIRNVWAGGNAAFRRDAAIMNTRQTTAAFVTGSPGER